MKQHDREIDVAAICAALGREFSSPELLADAFTHRSYANGRPGVKDNQRLEFLGDAVLDLLAAESLFEADGAADEGVLTARRSALVSGDALAAIAAKHDLAGFMRFADGVRDENELSGKRTAAALMEAVFGAAWLDGGIDAARDLFRRFFADELDARSRGDGIGDPRGRLQALAFRLGLGAPDYEIISGEGDGRNFLFRARVSCGGHAAEASGPNKRKAFAAAAEALLGELSDENNN